MTRLHKLWRLAGFALCSQVLGALPLFGCTQTTELLRAADLGGPRCVMTVDVFGGADVQLAGCGGPQVPPSNLGDGFYSPGNAQYEATLAGRLRSLLLADADLSAKFGWDYRVRACGFAGQTLASLTPTIPADSCGAPSAPSAMGVHSGSCANDPAAIVVLLATGEDDGCHGGGSGSPYADDKATFADHMATRIGAFVATRKPALLLLGPRTEWYSASRPPLLSPGVPDPAACAWKRGGWDESGIRRWQDLNPLASGVSLFGQIHADCQQHHPCCQSLDVPCVESWFVQSANDLSQLNCSGAQAVVDFWFARLKKTILQSQVQCPAR
ncbi:MAG: hypothetical protein U0787_04870 [Polyangia bacterium]